MEETHIKNLEQALSNALSNTLGDAVGFSGVQIQDGHAMFSLHVDPAIGAEMETLRQNAEKTALEVDGINKVTAILTAQKQNDRKKPQQLEHLPDIKHIIAVASGKGGVGKSTVAVNLAACLAKQGYTVGLMDADIYGPSVPRMTGLQGTKPDLVDGKLTPPQAHGMKIMSIGFLVDDETPMIWRGPMIQSALRQFLEDVEWGTLDYLIVDMPPGTGDAQLTMAQKVPLAGAVIVSTPQDIALLDARKAIEMFRKVNVPILGVIENMSTHICSQCGHEDHIFGHGGAKEEAQKQNVPFLGDIPLHRDIREYCDSGRLAPHETYDQIAMSIAACFESENIKCA